MGRNLKRVVVTGCGAVSPFGLGVPVLWEHLRAGDCAVRVVPEWKNIPGMNCFLAAPVPEFDAKPLLPRTLRRTMGKMAVYASIAAMEAVSDAGLSDELMGSGEVGVAIGSTTGSPGSYNSYYKDFLSERGLATIKSGEFFKLMSHSCSANVCLTLGISGEQWAPSSACTSSSQSIGLGYMLIQSGRQEVMLCGGAEEVHPSVSGIFDLLRAASLSNDTPEKACRPFDVSRNGVVCGGGSGILILESYESAKARGANIYCEITGFGNVNDSGHIANPDKKLMARAMQRALKEAGVDPAEIDYVNAHATATEFGDVAEAQAIAEIVGGSVPVSSMKGHLGHTLGAAGALELIATMLMMEKQEILPTLNIEKVDPLCQVANIELDLRG